MAWASLLNKVAVMKSLTVRWSILNFPVKASVEQVGQQLALFAQHW